MATPHHEPVVSDDEHHISDVDIEAAAGDNTTNPPPYEEPASPETPNEETPVKAQEDKEENKETEEDEDNDKGDDEQKEVEGVEMIIELPRDIYTGWILCRLLPRWNELSRKSQICIYLGVFGSLSMQGLVCFSLLGDIDFQDIKAGKDFDEWGIWFNLCALAVLFMYLWKDVIAFYNSVWFWIGKKEEEKGFSSMPGNLKDIGAGFKNMGSGIANIGKTDVSKLGERAQFGIYRALLGAVFFLYGILGLYSIVAIGAADGLVDKLEIGINIFFVLEINDWSASLFLFNPGVLDDADFDVAVVIEETQEVADKRVEKRLIVTTLAICGSIALVYLFSNYVQIIALFNAESSTPAPTILPTTLAPSISPTTLAPTF